MMLIVDAASNRHVFCSGESFCFLFTTFTVENPSSLLIQFCTMKHNCKKKVLIKCCFQLSSILNESANKMFEWIFCVTTLISNLFSKGQCICKKYKVSAHPIVTVCDSCSYCGTISDCAHSNLFLRTD